MRKVTVSYYEPDLDAVSSMYAYCEYLNKIGCKSNYYIEGIPKKEVGIVCDLFDIKLLGIDNLDIDDELIVLDTNNLDEVSCWENNKIVEIIDHHKKNLDTEKVLAGTKIQVEKIGAVATIIAEKFRDNNIDISRESILLLYYGIISNTINLKANITHQRDIEIVEWLRGKSLEITSENFKTIFERKSQIDESDLRKEMEADVVFDYKGKKMTVAQLEVANVDKFLSVYRNRIEEILSSIRNEKKIDYILINLVDILNGYNLVMVIDDETASIITNEFGYQFNGYLCQFNKLMQRKDLLFKLRA